MGNEQSADVVVSDSSVALDDDYSEDEETKHEPAASSSSSSRRGREGKTTASRSASPEKKRQHKAAGAAAVAAAAADGGRPQEEEEDEWLAGSSAGAVAAAGKQHRRKPSGGKKKSGGKGKGSDQPAGAATASVIAAAVAAAPPTPVDAAAAVLSSSPSGSGSGSSKAKGKKGKKQQQQQQLASPPPPSTPPTGSTATAAAASVGSSTSSASGKSIRWGAVTVTAFQRRPSQDTVPASGAWPLGLGEVVEGAVVESPLEEYERRRQEELDRRIQELPKRLRKVATGETRQFDYRSTGDRNPLFGPMGERDRKQVLLKSLLAEVDAGSAASSKQTAALEEQEKQRCVELDGLRASRKAIGCSCHQSKAPDKLSLKKLKDELHRRHLSAPGTDKAKLAELLREALRTERLCSEQAVDPCECFLAGVPCHADVCGCCGSKKGGSAGRALDCCNPKGNFLYKEGTVRGYRDRFVNARAAADGRPRSCTI